MEESKGIEQPVRIVTGDLRLTMRLMGFWQGLRLVRERCPRAAISAT